MTKPASIRKFDLFYLGSLAVGLLGLILGWDTMMAQMNAEFAAQGLDPEAGLATGATIVGFIFGFGVNLALWFLISVVRIEFVKWILVLFLLWGCWSVAVSVSKMGLDMISVVGLVSTVLSIAAVYMLFQPDAKEWFAAKRGD